MSRKKIIWLIILLAVAGGIWYGYKKYNQPNKDYKDVNPDFVLSATELIHDYEANDSIAALKYNDKDIEVSGNVKNIEKDEKGFYTIVLGDSPGPSSVRCSMDTTYKEDAAKLVTGSSATLRGHCTGFNKDEMGLGSDVILNWGVIVTKKD